MDLLAIYVGPGEGNSLGRGEGGYRGDFRSAAPASHLSRFLTHMPISINLLMPSTDARASKSIEPSELLGPNILGVCLSLTHITDSITSSAAGVKSTAGETVSSPNTVASNRNLNGSGSDRTPAVDNVIED